PAPSSHVPLHHPHATAHFPYTTLFRSPNEKLSDPVVRQAIAYGIDRQGLVDGLLYGRGQPINSPIAVKMWAFDEDAAVDYNYDRSEEHTSELQSRFDLVCRPRLEKKHD